MLAEQRLRKRVDADDLAAVRHRVEVGLEDLALLPARLEPRRGHDLAELLADAAAAARAREAIVDQAGELHRQGRGAARSRVPDVAPRARRYRGPVDPAVLPEAPVLAEDDRGQEGGRHLDERCPAEPAHRFVDADRLDRRAAPVDEGEVGRPMRRLHFDEARQRVRGGRRREGGAGDDDRGPRAREPRAAPFVPGSVRQPARRLHGATSIPALGDSPKLSGAYIASMRDGGSAKRPGLLRRTVYSTTCLPRGRYS